MDKKLKFVIFIFVLSIITYIFNPVPIDSAEYNSRDEKEVKKEYGEVYNKLGIDGEYLDKLHKNILKNKRMEVQSILIKKDGEYIFEEYYNTSRWAKENTPTEEKIYIGTMTQSILSALIGIAIDEGAIEDGLEAKPIDLFRDYAYEQKDEKGQISLEDLLMMKSGFYWVETNPFVDRKFMIKNYNPLSYALKANKMYPAGKYFNYNSGLSVILGNALEKYTGMDLEEYARKKLFDPMGIDIKWERHKIGQVLGSEGIYMTNRDMMKFLEMYRNKGVYKGRQIVPEGWVEESTTFKTKTYEYPKRMEEYGYHWWIPYFRSEGIRLKAYGTYEYGGKRAIVFEDQNLSILITANVEAEEYIYEQIKLYILPALGLRDVKYMI